jgi:hypothetical protein
MSEEIAWLIERADPNHPGCVLSEHFLGILGWFDGESGGGALVWLDRADDALRFARKIDAAKFVGMVQLLYDRLPHAQTLAGIRSGDIAPIVVEHSWS